MENLNEIDRCHILFEYLAPAFLHCGDRAITELDALYYFRICESEDYIQELTTQKIVNNFFISKRVQLFRKVCNQVILPVIKDTIFELHYATTVRYYQRVLCKKLGLGEELPASQYENRTQDLCYIKLETVIEDTFNEMSRTFLIKCLKDNLNSGQKGCLSIRCYEYLKDQGIDKGHLLDDDGLWTEQSCQLLLEKFSVK